MLNQMRNVYTCTCITVLWVHDWSDGILLQYCVSVSLRQWVSLVENID